MERTAWRRPPLVVVRFAVCCLASVPWFVVGFAERIGSR